MSGAVGHSRKDDSEKAEAVWYFKSGDGKNGTEKGVVKYDEKYYLKTFTSPSGKTYKSDPPITRTDGKWLLPLSYMYVKEVQAPEGYVKDNSEKTLRIKNAASQQDADGLYTNVTCPDAEATFINRPNEDEWRVRVQAKKVNETLKPLEGAVFYVYDNEACDGDPVAVLISGPDGMTNIKMVDKIPATQEEITLYCKEKEAPAGCALVDTKFPLTFKKSVFAKLSEAEKKEGELQVFGPPEGIVNKPFDGWKISVNLKKVKEDGSPLEGAEFGVFPDSVCAKEPYGTLISTADGTTNTLTIDVPNDQDEITVYCMETKAPKGYSLNKQVYQLTFRKEDYEKLTEEQKKTGEIKSFKGSDGNDIVNKEFDGWKVRVYAKKVNQSYEGLAGAVFEVYGDEACVNDLKGTLTSGTDGMTEDLIVEVPAGQTEITLYCKEVTAPEGCTPTDERFKVTFKQSDWNALPQSDKDAGGERKPFGPDKGIINQVTGTPTPTPPTPEGGQGGLYIKKTSTVDPEILKLNGYSLAGAVFEVTSDRDDSGTLTTKENGISESMPLKDYSWKEPHEAVLGPNDEVITEAWVETHHVTTNYIVTEIKPPKGHQVSHQKSDPIPVKTPDDNGKTFEVKFEDEPIFCKNKLDIEKLSSKGNPIEGVVFKVELFDSPSGESGNPVKTWYLESDKNGKIYLDDAHITHRLGYQSDPFFMHKGKIVIPIDCYLKFTEVAAPAEYIINDKPFGLPTGEDAELSYRAYNEPQPCEVKIKKYEADGSTPITGVEFEIKFLEEAIHANGNKHPNFKRLLEVGQTYVAHTDENGELVFKNLDQGKYEITEIKTETGHGLLKDPIIVTLPMTMTEEEASAYGNIDWGKGKEDVSYTDKWFFYSCLYEITNNANLKMPMSGGLGDWKYGFIGMGIIAMIGTSLIVHESLNKKRRKTHKRKKQKIDDFKI